MPANDVQEGEWWIRRDAPHLDYANPVEPEYYYYVAYCEDGHIELHNQVAGVISESWMEFYNLYEYAPWYVPPLAVSEDIVLREQARHPLHTITLPTIRFTREQFEVVQQQIESWGLLPSPPLNNDQYTVVERYVGERDTPETRARLDQELTEIGQERLRRDMYETRAIPARYLETAAQNQILYATRDAGAALDRGFLHIETSEELIGTIPIIQDLPVEAQPKIKTIWERLLEEGNEP